jgi:hypothetical protein
MALANRLFPFITSYSPGQEKPDLAISFLNGWTYDKMSIVKVIELGFSYILVLNILS